MKLIFIRHAEPYYRADSLTEKGFREAKLLAERTKAWPITQVYCSPNGRAQKTAEPTLAAHGIRLNHVYPDAPDDLLLPPDPKTAIVYPWLREFGVYVDPDLHPAHKAIAWDFTADYLDQHSELYDRLEWWRAPVFSASPEKAMHKLPKEITENPKMLELYQKLYGTHYELDPDVPQAKQEYEWVTRRLDDVLAQWGYLRDGLTYRVTPSAEPSDAYMSHEGRTAEDTLAYASATRSANTAADPSAVSSEADPGSLASAAALSPQQQALLPYQQDEPVLVFFCHLGIMGALISHLINTSPTVLHQGFFAAPSSVTILSAEEWTPGKVWFRVQTMGDTSHLRQAGEIVSYYGEFAAPYQL